MQITTNTSNCASLKRKIIWITLTIIIITKQNLKHTRDEPKKEKHQKNPIEQINLLRNKAARPGKHLLEPFPLLLVVELTIRRRPRHLDIFELDLRTTSERKFSSSLRNRDTAERPLRTDAGKWRWSQLVRLPRDFYDIYPRSVEEDRWHVRWRKWLPAECWVAQLRKDFRFYPDTCSCCVVQGFLCEDLYLNFLKFCIFFLIDVLIRTLMLI